MRQSSNLFNAISLLDLPEQRQVVQWQPPPQELDRAQCEHDAQNREQGQHIRCEYALLHENNRVGQPKIGVAHGTRKR